MFHRPAARKETERSPYPICTVGNTKAAVSWPRVRAFVCGPTERRRNSDYLEGADKFFTPKAAHNTCHTY